MFARPSRVATLILACSMSSVAGTPGLGSASSEPAGLVAAQGDDGPVLTLAEALAQARAQSPDLKVVRERLVQAESAVSRAWRSFHPTLTASGTYTHNNVAATFNADGEEVTTQAKDQLGAQADLRWSVFDVRRYAALGTARDQEHIARLSESQVRRDLLLNVAATYLLGVQTQKLADAAQALTEARRQQARQAEARHGAGLLQKSALVRAQLDVVRAEGVAERARFDTRSAKSQLANLLGRSDAAFELAEPQEAPLPLQEEFGKLLERALSDRPEVAAAKLNEQLAARLATDAWAQFVPRLDFAANGRWSNVGGIVGANTTWALTLALTVPLYDGGFRYVQLREAASRQRETRALTSAQTLRIADELRRGLLDLDSARALARTAEKALELARENDRLVHAQFEAGQASQIEVSDATANAFQAEADVLRERLAVKLSSLRLMRAIGAFDP